MEFVNRICPNCKNPNYMVSLGDFAKVYKYKCMNCNGYFNDIDFEKEPLQPVWKSKCMNTKVDSDGILLKCDEIDSLIENEQEQSYAMYLISQKVYEIRELVRKERKKNDR